MAKKKSNNQLPRFSLSLKTSARVLTEHLGRQKYSTPTKALAELISNAFDAQASVVSVDLGRNALDLVETITVRDNGNGMTEWDLKERFQVVGITSPAESSRLGRFGVGRLAVFRLGFRSHWRTVAKVDAGTRTRHSFDLDCDSPSDFEVTPEHVDLAEPTGTEIVIAALADSETEHLTTKKVTWDLFAEFAGYLLAYKNRRLVVDGQPIDVDGRISHRYDEMLEAGADNIPATTMIQHLMLKAVVFGSKAPEQLIYTAKGVAVERLALPVPPAPNYLAIVTSPYLDQMVAENRAAFINMDSGMVSLKDAVGDRIRVYGDRLRKDRADDFIKRAREKPYYPYKVATNDAVTHIEQTLYDRVLEFLNTAVNVEHLGPKQQKLIFDLLHRSLRDENLLHVLDGVANLSDKDIAELRELLERTTLQSIIQLASVVTERLTFLDVLQDVAYEATLSKHVKERSQLHKILEGNCWLFGSQYHLAASDKGFRTIIRALRAKANLDDAPPDDQLSDISGISQIPDLFLSAKRTYMGSRAHGHHHLLVELKRPNVPVNLDVVNQGERYASVISKSSQFVEGNTSWDVFLISSRIEDDIVEGRRQPQGEKPFGVVSDIKNVRIWTFSWAEIIDRARMDMQLVREHLAMKSRELSSSEYLQKHFPHAFPALSKDDMAHSEAALGARNSPASKK